MRFIFYAGFIFFTCFCIIVAVSNGDNVTFSLFPLPVLVDLPAYMLVFMGILIGLGGGWLVSIYSGIRHARRHRLADKKIKELENKLKSMGVSNIELSNDKKHGKSTS
ncbi:LapA family protein [Pseudemcibacter aquimaris]|uniref:LapA family protein n=1 Tax=Pseudemcibacter aquimaris TaxID=2857064 RepID=UPI00201296AD|nr:LapA family protein [Pseudemcibacter aquimaris]MCC3862478.1 LapA family protein [Pseudemcibacter aquimaris]WDU59094.1 LapA family protein [Pseudemcibacter aquimaris]